MTHIVSASLCKERGRAILQKPMNIFTHALAPVIATRLLVPRAEWAGRAGLLAIAFAGALPDLLSPHITLEQRMTSWSHGLPAWAGFSCLLACAAFFSKGRISVPLAGFMSGAYLLHMFCDAVAGGINWLQPFGNLAWGEYWVGPLWWIPLDIGCVLTCYYLFRLKPMLAARRRARARIAPPDPPY